MNEVIKSRRGFAAMDPARQREIASRGGKVAHERGKAHEFSVDEARGAGRKGGLTISQDREHMAAIGREGGFARARRAKQLREQGQSVPSSAQMHSAEEPRLHEMAS